MKQKYRVVVSREAKGDLIAIYRYVARAASGEMADHLLDGLEATCAALEQLPRRGRVPPELERVAVFDFLEVQHPPYRIVYEIAGKKVILHAVFDGRRDMAAILAERLLR